MLLNMVVAFLFAKIYTISVSHTNREVSLDHSADLSLLKGDMTTVNVQVRKLANGRSPVPPITSYMNVQAASGMITSGLDLLNGVKSTASKVQTTFGVLFSKLEALQITEEAAVKAKDATLKARDAAEAAYT